MRWGWNGNKHWSGAQLNYKMPSLLTCRWMQSALWEYKRSRTTPEAFQADAGLIRRNRTQFFNKRTLISFQSLSVDYTILFVECVFVHFTTTLISQNYLILVSRSKLKKFLFLTSTRIPGSFSTFPARECSFGAFGEWQAFPSKFFGGKGALNWQGWNLLHNAQGGNSWSMLTRKIA